MTEGTTVNEGTPKRTFTQGIKETAAKRDIKRGDIREVVHETERSGEKSVK